jgi:uncharacterized protein
MLVVGLIVLGILAGGLAGIFGVGGAILIIPALVYFFGFSQKTAQGTSLALLLPPIGAFAAYNYYKVGAVDFKAAGYIIIGFLLGSWLSSRYAANLHSADLSRAFGIFLLVVAAKLIITG